jgi:putative peptidoglycan lipid II flippase
MNREQPQLPDKIQESRRQIGRRNESGSGTGIPQPPGMPHNIPTLPPQNLPAQPPVSPSYTEPMDMGTTLSFGQGMDYQYFEVPQPSQAMPQLRMERLQQLRQERLRRDVQHARPDITTLIKRRGGSHNSAPLTLKPSGPLTGTPAKINSVPLANLPPAAVAAAAQPAQNTAMLKKARIGRASALLMGAFVASRVLGLVRTSMFAATFGTGSASDAFIQASLLPDMVFNIIAGGALSSAFIPTFTKYMVGENNEQMAWRIANTALTLAVAIMVVLAAVGAIFAEPIVRLSSPSFVAGQIELTANLVRIMFLQAIILGGGVIVTSVLNAQQNFQLPAIGTVLYNVGNILGLLPGLALAIANHRNDELAVFCAALGVVLGAALNIGIQMPGLRKVGMHYRPDFDWRLPGISQIGKQMLPRIFNASVLSVATFLDRYLIGLLGVVLVAGTTGGLLTQYYQATQLLMLPLGIFGMAMSTAAFPTLTEYFAKKRLDRFRSVILETLRSILVLSIPSGIGLIILAEPIIQTLLGHGRFLPSNVTSMAIPLAFFAVGLAGLAAVEILTRSFYAMSDSKTPVIISILQFAFKIALGLLFLDPFTLLGGHDWGASWGMGALAFSTSISNLAEAVVLFIILDQRIGELLKPALLYFILRVLGASLCMGVVVLVSRILLDTLTVTVLHIGSNGLTGFLVSLIKLVIELFVGTFVYLRSSRLFKIEELGPIRRLLDRFKLSWMM